MRNFILGVVVTLAVIAAAAYVYMGKGYIDMRADQEPSSLEKKYATEAMDSATERHAPKLLNPVRMNDQNLREGMAIYLMNCSQCHGGPKEPESKLGKGFYPPVPQFMKDTPDLPENHSYYIIKHGIRWTGMPAWGNVLTDQELWKVTMFLENMEKLPPALKKDWEQAGGSAVP